MKLPNAERAVVDLEKLRDYCLNPEHPRGKHKAKVFVARIGLTNRRADMLREAILTAARSEDAVLGKRDEYGQRYLLDFDFKGPWGSGRIRSTWIVRRGEDFPRLTTCYLL